MLQLKEKEIDKFLTHDRDKYMAEIKEICNSEKDFKEGIERVLYKVFSAGFNCGVKTSVNLLKKFYELQE